MNSTRRNWGRVESNAAGHHHQPCSEPLRAGLFQRAERLALHRCGSGLGIKGHPTDGLIVGGRCGSCELALPVGRQPRGIERHRAWVGPQPLELVEQHTDLSCLDVPLDAAFERRTTEVARTHERHALARRGVAEDVRLRMEAGRRVGEHTDG
jgi:hypothetical protein